MIQPHIRIAVAVTLALCASSAHASTKKQKSCDCTDAWEFVSDARAEGKLTDAEMAEAIDDVRSCIRVRTRQYAVLSDDIDAYEKINTKKGNHK